MRVSGQSARVSEAAVMVLSWCCHEILIASDEELTVRGVGCQGKGESGRGDVLSAGDLVWGEDIIPSYTWPGLAIPFYPPKKKKKEKGLFGHPRCWDPGGVEQLRMLPRT